MKIYSFILVIILFFYNKNSQEEFVKIRIFDESNKSFLKDFKLVTSCIPEDEKLCQFDERKGFYSKGQSLIVKKKKLFSMHNIKNCYPHGISLVVIKNKKYYFFKINEKTKDTLYHTTD